MAGTHSPLDGAVMGRPGQEERLERDIKASEGSDIRVEVDR